MNTFYI